jgi:hypothetical protein
MEAQKFDRLSVIAKSHFTTIHFVCVYVCMYVCVYIYTDI